MLFLKDNLNNCLRLGSSFSISLRTSSLVGGKFSKPSQPTLAYLAKAHTWFIIVAIVRKYKLYAENWRMYFLGVSVTKFKTELTGILGLTGDFLCHGHPLPSFSFCHPCTPPNIYFLLRHLGG